MPNRIIREGWLDSSRVNDLDAESERFFLRLCLRADDFGRYSGNPVLLKSMLFPVNGGVKVSQIVRWIGSCSCAGLVRPYTVDGKEHLEIPKFGQRTRAQQSKFPAPPVDDGQMADICQTNDSQPRTYSETETIVGDGGGDDNAPASARMSGNEVQPTFPEPLDTDLFKAAWSEWMEYRREQRARPYKAKPLTAQLVTLAAWGHDQAIESIRQSIRQQWTGLFEPKNNNHSNGQFHGRKATWA